MAEPKKKRKKKKRGPQLAAAVFCEALIEDKSDGAISAIRIFDTFNVVLPSNTPSDFPSAEKRLRVPLWVLLSFKTGDSPGKHRVRVVMESPSGKSGTAFEQDLHLEPPAHGGFNLRLNTNIMVMKGGLFWAHVYLDGKRMTSMPLQVTVQRAEVPGGLPDDVAALIPDQRGKPS
jgi:hypothetical protein